ncbi:uncharacterized protein LOC114962999 [Acropora millepora]|uniref:uncharacterized protein LOC114962999 n=1 Tax=Acropora millepora TaxID=45264 RepID=UPI001CF4CA13|nr:uncharacterized protein LOC114962999 [Acropora millepora]
MFACCCIAKIFIYVFLICYHICDVFFDWYNFALLRLDHKFSGVSLSASKGSAIEILFVVSCFTGTLFSVALMYTYGCYIGHHWYCMNNASYSAVNYSNGCVSFLCDRKCDKKCNRKYVNRELWISFLGLFLNDGIQSGILFWAFNCPQRSFTSYPHQWMSIGFLVCSIVGNLKLCLCFITKLCGCGEGEELCPEESEEFCACCAKAFLCTIGILGSAIFLSAIFVVLIQTDSLPEKMAMAPGRSDTIFERVSTRSIHELCRFLNLTDALLNKTSVGWF